MKNKIAIVYSGLMNFYLNKFLQLCDKYNIVVDMFFFKGKENNNLESKYINKTFFLKTFLKSKSNRKDINIKKIIEKEIKNLVDINAYDFIIVDGPLGLSFTCNIFHYNSLNYRIKTETNYLYQKILQIGHFKNLMADKSYYKNCPKVVAVSNEIRKDLINNYNISPDKIFVIHPACSNLDIEGKTKRTEDSKKTKFIIGSVTCGFSTKGGYTVLGALRKLLKRRLTKDIEIRFINPKFDKQILLKIYLKLFKLEKYVKFYTYQNDMKKFYSELDCLVCASKYEAFGRVAGEAMLFYIPVIVASNVGACDIIKDGENGFIFKRDKNIYSNLADKLEELIVKYDYYDYIKQKAHDTVINITWENFSKKLFFGLYPSLDDEKS